MSEGYVQTLLLDANRLNSEEYNGSSLSQGTSNAVFTNKVSSGITLDIGDKVSVQQAFISERGAGGSVIEFKGERIGNIKTLEYTNSVSSSFVGYAESPTSYAYESSSLITEDIPLKDNEVSFVIQYHMNSNGENYLTLPRNFANASTLETTGGGVSTYEGWDLNASYWTSVDGYPLGMNTVAQNASHVYEPDWHEIDHDYANASGATNIVGARPRKIKNDNSKFTLFKQNEIVWNGSYVSAPVILDYTSQPANYYDPACHAYQVYKEKKTIRVGVGYDSPSNIASTITDQLIEADDPIPLDKLGIADAPGSTVVNASLYKAFPATNYSRFNGSTNHEYTSGFSSVVNHSPIGWRHGIAGSAPNASAIMWANAFGYVGFKRPKFVEQGRDTFAYHGNYIETMSSTDTEIKTNITWSLPTLTRIKDWFDIQHDLYPELIKNLTQSQFTNYATHNTTSASLNASFLHEARFFHMGSSHTAGYPSAPLGDDMYNVSYTDPADHSGDRSSKPLSIYFNNNCSNLSPEYWDGENDDQLAFGFARKHADGTIIFTTERIGGIQASYCDTAGVPRTLTNNTKIGYDYHFNAYGNSAIMLHNGFNYDTYYAGTGSPEGGSINAMTYVGANNALLNFDTTQNRFELSNLHTAEKVGNFYNAGNTTYSTTVLAPSPSAQGGLDCYKINKVFHYDNWSPSMRPYPVISLASASSQQTAIIPFSYMLQEFEIYDANCGVTIVDMGIEETEWSNSLWGILGFSYNQFNPTENIVNINSRITNNSVNVSGATTDASIVSTDSLNYPVNIYGVNLYNTQLLTEYTYSGVNTFPPVSVLANSTTLTADDLPRKVLRGYFLIESDILSDANYYLTANPLQVMAIANKYSAQTDFVNYDGANSVKFTVTKKKVLTDIVTKIKDPDGSIAQVGSNSAVIYKVEKQIDTNLNFATDLLAQQK
jgi:hypothetical protein